MTEQEIVASGLTVITKKRLQYVFINCRECGKEIMRRINCISSITKYYCSNICRHNNTYVTISCLMCKKEMSIPKSWYPNKKYCSIKCKSLKPKQRKYFNCINCGKEDYYSIYQEKYYKRIGIFCTRQCKYIYYKNNHEYTPNYKNGKTTTGKYIKLSKFNIQEHRYVMENIIGRKLTKKEVVHHIDGNGFNNNKENLILMTKIEHHKLHYKTRKIDAKGRLLAEKEY